MSDTIDDLIQKFTDYEEHDEYHYDCNIADGHVEFDEIKFKQSLADFINREVISEDIAPNTENDLLNAIQRGQNRLKKHQRARVDALLKSNEGEL